MGPKRAGTSGTGSTMNGRRSRRARPKPRWLGGRPDLDPIAQRRCMMLLSVLSGEKPVSTAIEELGLSRGTYYQLETKALLAMLAALTPGVDGATTASSASAAQRIADLEAKVLRLEQEKRRGERLLYLVRKLVPMGALTTGRGRPPKARVSMNKARSSKIDGAKSSPPSTKATKKRAKLALVPPDPASTPTTDGGTTR